VTLLIRTPDSQVSNHAPKGQIRLAQQVGGRGGPTLGTRARLLEPPCDALQTKGVATGSLFRHNHWIETNGAFAEQMDGLLVHVLQVILSSRSERKRTTLHARHLLLQCRGGRCLDWYRTRRTSSALCPLATFSTIQIFTIVVAMRVIVCKVSLFWSCICPFKKHALARVVAGLSTRVRVSSKVG